MTLVDLDDIPTEDETPRPFLIFEHLFRPAAVAPPTTTPPHPPSVDAPPPTATPPPPAVDPGGTHFNEQDEPPKDEPPKDKPPKDEQGPRFKDQVHPDYVEPDIRAEAIEEGKEEEEDLQEEAQEEHVEIPIAGARLITDTRIELEDLVQQLDLDRQHLEEQLEQQAVSKKRWIRGIIVAAVGLVAGVAAFLSICGTSGNCRGSDSKGTSPVQSVAATTIAPSAMPTAQPTLYDTSILSFINNITLTGRSLRYPNNSTAEERALLWLIDVDRSTTGSDLVILRQRYALATLWFQTPTGFGSSGWATGITECDWEDVDCDAAGRLVTSLFPFGDIGGQIPADLGLLTDLTDLSLGENALEGTIPSSIASLTALTFLGLGVNELEGTIPSSIDSWTDLTYLDLSGNALTGTLPTTVAALTDLNYLYLYNNGLTGTMPFCNSVSNQAFGFLVADCDNVRCPCCTHCCPTSRDGIPVYDYC